MEVKTGPCSFCEKGNHEVLVMITGIIAGDIRVFICAECVKFCVDILRKKKVECSSLIIRESKLDEWFLSRLLGDTNPEHITIGAILDMYAQGETALTQSFKLRRELRDLEKEKADLARWDKEVEQRMEECRRRLAEAEE